MASWKKVIVSGSRAVLADVTASAFSGDGSGLSGISADSLANALSVDNATIELNSGTTFNGSAARTISVKDGGIDSDALASGVAGTGLTGGGGSALSLDINGLAAETIATGDELVFSDIGDNGIHKETVDDLFTKGPALVTEAAIAQADDYIVFLDGGASGDAKKESVADFVDAINGTGLDAQSGQLKISAAQTGITSIVNSSLSKLGTDSAQEYIKFDTANEINVHINNNEKLSVHANGITVTGHITASSSITGSFVGDGSGLTGVTAAVDIDSLSALGGTGLAQGDHFIFSDGGTEKKITFSNLEDAIFANIDSESTEVAMSAGGRLTIENDTIDNDKLANMTRGTIKVGGGSNAPTDLDAKTSGQILVGDGTDIASVAVSGDVSLASNGAVTIAANAVEGSMLNSNVAGTGLTYAGSNLDVDLSGESAVTIGAGTSEVTVGDNLTVAGDLTVNGSQTIVSTTNLLVEDKFILLASGSSAGTDGGIVVQSATAGTGASLVWDTGVDRWAIAGEGTLAHDATGVDANTANFDYVVAVSGSAKDPVLGTGAAGPKLGASNHKYGMMHVNTTSGDIFIYS